MTLAHFEQLESYLPIPLNTWEGFAAALAVITTFILIRYFILVGSFYGLFWRRRSARSASTRKALHDQNIKPDQIAFEIRWSVISSLIFALAGYLIGLAWQLDLTLLYLKFDQYGLWYLPVSLILLSLLHEVYFYATHIWMHKPRVYRAIHSVHHYSVKTSPWASFSFHPGEAVIQAAFLPLALFVIPLHPTALIFYLTWMTITAISNHLGVELIRSSWLRGWFISGEHHAAHHQQFNCNYGLYYRFMDQLFSTDRMPQAKKPVTKEHLCESPLL